MNDDDRRYMEMAIGEARKQLDRFGLDEGGERPHPKVGCVVVTKDGNICGGYRGERGNGDHAEFTVLEKKMPHEVLAGATVYTTLEPCMDRAPPRKSCADRLIERKVSRVLIGCMDPDDRGQGLQQLLDANISVELFPSDLMQQIQELNRRFIESRKKEKAGRMSEGRIKWATSVASPHNHAIDALNWYRGKRHDLSKIARSYYEKVALAEFPVVTIPKWLPERPIPLHVIDCELQKNWRANEPDASPPTLDALGKETYSDFMARVTPDVRQDNNFCYRLLSVSTDGGSFEFNFGPSYYRNFVSSCDALGYELAEWSLRANKLGSNMAPQQDGLDLVARGRPATIFDLLNRSACPATSAVLILLNTRKGDYFYVHQRKSPYLLDSPGGWHVVPSGQFQPDTAEDVHHARDFAITRTVIRELAEELLGVKEVEKAIRNYNDFYDDPRVAPFVAGLKSGAVRPYFMGLGFDALPTKPGFYLALVIDAAGIPDASLNFFDNWEGEYLAVPLEALETWSKDTRMIPDGATCLKLAVRHLEILVGEHRKHS